MANKDFIHQRICIFAKTDFDPAVDEQVVEVLRSRFDIHLPQRASINESLAAVTGAHEIIELILQYRTMDQ